MPLENKQIEAMAAWTLEDFQDDPLAAIEQVRELAAAHLALQREREAAVRDLEKLMYLDSTFPENLACDMCVGECRELNVCRPKWRWPQKEMER